MPTDDTSTPQGVHPSNMPEMEHDVVNERKLIRRWNDAKGDWDYTLIVKHFDEIHIRIPRRFSSLDSGDREWAERQAEHYGIEIEE